jgi:hypothetical protein
MRADQRPSLPQTRPTLARNAWHCAEPSFQPDFVFMLILAAAIIAYGCLLIYSYNVQFVDPRDLLGPLQR